MKNNLAIIFFLSYIKRCVRSCGGRFRMFVRIANDAVSDADIVAFKAQLAEKFLPHRLLKFLIGPVKSTGTKTQGVGGGHEVS